jgi:hypothetical protein
VVTLIHKDGQGIQADGTRVTGKELTLDAAECGINDDFMLTPVLAKILKENKHIIDQRLPIIQKSLLDHRRYFAHLATSKIKVLSYQFLLKIYGEDDVDLNKMQKWLNEFESNPIVKQLPDVWVGSLSLLEERMKCVCRR